MKKALLIILISLIAVFGGFAVANAIHAVVMNDYIDSFAKVEIENQLTPKFDEDGVPYFETDDDFKIMHLTDVHIGGGVLSAAKDKKAINAVAAMVTAEKPDLVIVTGDISYAVPWSGTMNNRYAHEMFKRLMENLGVYWTVTLGNHDSEIYNFFGRESVGKIYEDSAFEYCLFSRGPAEIFGECNHVINVKNSKGLITESLIMMDSNSYTDEDPLGINWIYDHIRDDQVEWYEGVVEKYSAENRSVYESLPESERPANSEDFLTVKSMLFIHIPLMEVREAYENHLENSTEGKEDVLYIEGNVGEESPYVYCGKERSKIFNVMLSLGSTQAVFYGHDHLNNLVMEYKGITLSYGYSIDYFAYSDIDKIGAQRGCSVITCSPDTSFEIVHENYYQDKYPSKYEKEVVDMTK
ncbi:MAG: hypothetical protein E7676_00805 [Ruminococcaceae bacterium]|nr:hypothetical protein [Oscillospiraceae bacterium]